MVACEPQQSLSEAQAIAASVGAARSKVVYCQDDARRCKTMQGKWSWLARRPILIICFWNEGATLGAAAWYAAIGLCTLMFELGPHCGHSVQGVEIIQDHRAADVEGARGSARCRFSRRNPAMSCRMHCGLSSCTVSSSGFLLDFHHWRREADL